jgi:Uma2 family endonuclease
MITDEELEMAVPVPIPTAENPYAIGWRYRDEGTVVLPLTQADLLWQEEGDKIPTNYNHVADMFYLFDILGKQTQGKPGVRVFSDHCINFQIEGLGILGPDVIMFNGEPGDWDGKRGTFPVKDMGARPLYAFEITSPSTRPRDLRERLDQYYRAGVPVFVLIDAPYGGGKRPQGIVQFQAGPSGYERLPRRPDGRIWVEVAEVWVGLENGRVACFLPNGDRVPDGATLLHNLSTARAQLAEETQRADGEKARAEAVAAQAAAEKERAEAATTRADAAAAQAAAEKDRAEAEKARAAAAVARADAEKERAEAAATRADAAAARAEAAAAQAAAEKDRAEAEKARAEAAAAQATAERARADEVARKMAELEAELRRLRGETGPSA